MAYAGGDGGGIVLRNVAEVRPFKDEAALYNFTGTGAWSRA